MDPIENPFAPGAGTPPPELAGRKALQDQLRIAIARVRRGLQAKSALMVGLRGVGKTVLLDQMRKDAKGEGIQTLRIEAPEDRSLPAILAPELRQALLRLSQVDHAKDFAKRALQALTGFARAMKLKFSDIEVGFDFDAEPGLADNGDLEHDLQQLLETAGLAAQKADTALAIFADEMQYIKEPELAALITALHLTAQNQLPVILIGAGLPQLRGQMGKAKSYAERMFDFPVIGALTPEATKDAISAPAKRRNVDVDLEALTEIVQRTHCYPYFVQEWGKHSWDIAERSPITRSDVIRASTIAVAALDESFFRVRFDRLTPAERKYLRAMADLGAGPHRSGDIAQKLHREVTALGPTRNNLIAKGMVWSPGHGDTAFTVPLFDEFMRRIMPGDEWQQD